MHGRTGTAIPCARCGQATAIRRGRAPRFCANCGTPLALPAERVRHEFAVVQPFAPGAAAALICGLGSFICVTWLPFLLGVAAILLGWSARKRIDRNPGQFRGRGLATLGLVLGVVNVCIQLAARVL